MSSPSALSPTTTNSVAPFPTEQPAAQSAEQCVVIVAVDRFATGRPRSGIGGSIHIDDFVAQLGNDPEWAAELENSRKELAEELGLGHSLASMRLARGLSQRELARRIGASQPQIARLELGQGNPGVATLRKLARELGVRIEQVLLAFEQSQTP
jgi:DNA-binding XRE family transcriptional regulator